MPAHVSSQGQEAIGATHDTFPQVIKATALYYKKTYLHYLHNHTTIDLQQVMN